ncbi:unnamed protein product [Phytophthora fragariaefolia]|uniref:Unnamed protein product n=1 Tax=Phytophthora fragariaefolia TaxID=1490495 RepID=A0A9W6YFJ7_9STRA|nr:unnamed protein product [Phytophthora fragariaefolia]
MLNASSAGLLANAGSPVAIGASTTLATDTTGDVARSVQFEDDDARGQGYDEEDEDDEEKEEVDVKYVKSTAELLGEVEELSLQVSRMGNPRPVERNLVAELDASADDGDDEDDQGVVQGELDDDVRAGGYGAGEVAGAGT